MDHSEVEQTLSDVERAFAQDADANLSGRGFWTVVAAAKNDPELVATFGDRISNLDREGFLRWAILTIPLGIGTLIAITGTGFGLVLVAMSFSTDGPANGLLMLVGMFVLFTTLHSLAHLIVGRIVGIRFTHWFVGTIGRPQPGVKTDYASYLRTPAAGRAWMHAAGAIVSKIVPFALLPVALAAEVPGWAIGGVVLMGVTGLVTDTLISRKSGDWKKFKREMSFVSSE